MLAVALVLALVVSLPLSVAGGDSKDLESSMTQSHALYAYLEPLSETERCDACLVFVQVLDALATLNGTEAEVETALTSFCDKFLTKEFPLDNGVCKDIIRTFGPTVWPILIHITISPREVCAFVKLCPSGKWPRLESRSTSVTEARPSFDSGKHSSNLAKVNESGFFLQITDIHLDLMYAVGSYADCGLPLCCHPWNKNGSREAAKWGDFNCDTPLPLLNATLRHIASSNKSDIDFIVWTGDNPAHNDWNQSKAENLQNVAVVAELLNMYFEGIPVFPIIGNHDTYPVDQFSRKQADNVHHDNFDWLLKGLSEMFAPWLDANATSTFQQGGYYTQKIIEGLRVVALNTQWDDTLNFYLLLQENQQQAQIEWLELTLKQAAALHEKVILIGHIPSGEGAPANYSAYGEQYLSIVRRYNSTIAAQIFGHTHTDSFELVFDEDRTPVSVIYIAPSLTPYTSHNPAYRLYEYDRSTFEIKDIHTFFLNLTQTNAENSPAWYYEYSARSAYNLTDLSPLAWYDLVQRLSMNEALFETFYQFYYTEKSNLPACDSVCKKLKLCSLLSSTPAERASCVQM